MAELQLLGHASWRTRVTMGVAAPGWRGRLAAWLRDRAARLDGQYSLAVQFDTTPALSAAQKQECLRMMFEAGYDAAFDTARSEALEAALRQARPELYADLAPALPARR